MASYKQLAFWSLKHFTAGPVILCIGGSVKVGAHAEHLLRDAWINIPHPGNRPALSGQLAHNGN